MGLLERVTEILIHKRDADAGDTPGATRLVSYTDSSGVQSGKYRREVRLYNGTGGAIVAGTVLLVHYTGAPSTSPQVKVTATNTPTREVVVAPYAVPTATWGWFCCGGWVDALVEGTTAVAAADLLKIVQATGANSFIKDSSTVYSTGTIAVAGAAQAAGGEVITLVELLGGKAIIA
jgi:hypothetical protein